MTSREYLKQVKDAIKQVLLDVGLVDGDKVAQNAYLPNKTYFFESYNEKPEFQKTTYVCWNLLETQTLRHGDNAKIGAEQFFAVVVVTPQKLESKAVKTLIDKIETEFIDDDSWNIIDYVNLIDNETKTNFANFTISKVFGK